MYESIVKRDYPSVNGNFGSLQPFCGCVVNLIVDLIYVQVASSGEVHAMNLSGQSITTLDQIRCLKSAI